MYKKADNEILPIFLLQTICQWKAMNTKSVWE